MERFCHNFFVKILAVFPADAEVPQARRRKSKSPQGPASAFKGFTAFYEAAPLRYALFREFVHLSQTPQHFRGTAFPARAAESGSFCNLPKPAPPGRSQWLPGRIPAPPDVS